MESKINEQSINKIVSSKNVEISTKIEILKLYNYLKKFYKINYIEKEYELYNMLGVKDKISKINFEIQRINKKLNIDHAENYKFKERYELIKNTYELLLNDALANIKIKEERIEELLERIIMLEFDMQMKIGLYEEMEFLLNKKINNTITYYNLNENTYVYNKKDWFNNGKK